MLASSVHQFLTLPVAKTSKSRMAFWFGLSMTFAAIYSLMALQQAFSAEYVVQDDARQHIFWIRRYLDPGLFPNDLIADYFQSVAPRGYKALYWLFTRPGIDPLILSKFLPSILCLITTAYGFGVALQLLPIPATGFIATLLLNQTLWSQDDLASATPRAFLPPIFLAFLYYLMKRFGQRATLKETLLPCLITIALEGLFYPQYVFIFAGLLILQLVRWENGRICLTRDRQDYWFCGVGLVVAFAVMLPFALSSSVYGPTITGEEARQIPDFLPRGRAAFFYDDKPLYFWFSASRSGILPTLKPPLFLIGLSLPWLLRLPQRFPLAQQVNQSISVLVRLILVAFFLFFAAHAVLYKLHLPSRYTGTSLRVVFVYSSAIALMLLIDAVLRGLARSESQRKIFAWGFLGLVAIALISYPSFEEKFPDANYVEGDFPKVYQFFAQQPQDILIASTAEEANDLPTYSQRSVLIGREFAVPYHVGYANQFRQRANDLIQAQYSLDRATLQAFIRQYGIDFWLVTRNAFTVDYLDDTWIRQYPEAVQQATSNLQQDTPVLQRLSRRCTVLRERAMAIVDAQCLLEQGR